MTTRSARLRRSWARNGPRVRDVVFIVARRWSRARRDARPPGRGSAGAGGLVLVVGLAGAAALWWRRPRPVAVTAIGVVVFAVVVGAGHRWPSGCSPWPSGAATGCSSVMTLVAAAAFTVVPAIHSSSSWVGFLVSGLDRGRAAHGGRLVRRRPPRPPGRRCATGRRRPRSSRSSGRSRRGSASGPASPGRCTTCWPTRCRSSRCTPARWRSTPAAGPEQVRQTAGVIRTTAREAMEDLRDVLGVLRAGSDGDGTDLAPPPRGADIERLVEASRHGRACGRRPDDGGRRAARRRGPHGLSGRAGGADQRAQARRAPRPSVRITGDGAHGVTVEVVQPPPGGGAPRCCRASGTGLVGLRERVALVGGTLESGPTPDGGWRVAPGCPPQRRPRAPDAPPADAPRRPRPVAPRDPRARHRRRGPGARRAADDPRVGRRHRRRRRGRRRRRRGRGGPPLPARRRADGHPDAPAGRPGGDRRRPRGSTTRRPW